MPPMDPTFQRVNGLCERVLASLPKNYALNRNEHPSKYAFSISRKSTAQDPNKSGKSWDIAGEMTYQELVSIANTSQSEEQAMQRIRSRIMTGQDPQHPAPVDGLDAEIERRVALEVRRHLESIAAATRAPDVPRPMDRARSQSARKNGKIVSMAVWVDRAAKMGIDAPVARPSHPSKVDGRWLRRAEPLWSAYEARMKTMAETAQ